MSTPGVVFTVRAGQTVRHLKSQNVPLEYWYYSDDHNRQFDVRELPVTYLQSDTVAVNAGCMKAHRRVIQRALLARYNFRNKQ